MPLLFDCTLEYAIRKVQENPGGNENECSQPQLLVYADDVNKSIGWQHNYYTEKQKFYMMFVRRLV
jgi:hypothetical protein